MPSIPDQLAPTVGNLVRLPISALFAYHLSGLTLVFITPSILIITMGSDLITGRVPMLVEGGYEVWRMSMEAVLIATELWEVVGPEVTNLMPKGPKGSQAKEVKRNMARARIILTLDPSQLPFVMGLEDPRAIWKELESVHRSVSVNSTLSLRRRFFNLKKLESETTLAWISRVRGTAIELSHTPAPVNPLDIILVITDGLPEEYQPVITALDGLPFDQLTVSLVISRLTGFEAQLSRGQSVSDSENLAARVRHSEGSEKCWNCGGIGHTTRVCPTRKDSRRIRENSQRSESDVESANTAAEYGLGPILL